MIPAVLHPIVTGPVIARVKAGLTARPEGYTDNVTVTRKRNATATARMVSVDDRGGPVESVQARRILGFNVWAEDSVTAELLALMVQAIVTTLPDGNPITHVDGVTVPEEVEDVGTDKLTVGTATLAHYFFTARVSVRGTDL